MIDPVLLDVVTPGGRYPVVVGPDVLARAVDLLPQEVRRAEVLAVVSDASVAALHGPALDNALAALPARVEHYAIEPGERSKDVATAESLWRWLAATGLHRGDAVLALGGGVVGDLAGFAAATYHRGIAFVQVPTTLLGQVDASIGGKTALDLPEGKNLVGAFHQPRAVLADVGTLATLPDAAFATGMAEVIKHGLIADNDLLDRLARDADAIDARDPGVLTHLVADAARVKVDVVNADERESGVRAHLNYGHTLGHALEALGGYERFTHGEAVAIGMMFVAHVAVALGFEDLIDVHRRAIEAAGLPTGGAEAPYEQVATAWKADKKYERGVRFVLLRRRGEPTLVGDIDDAVLREAYEAVR